MARVQVPTLDKEALGMEHRHDKTMRNKRASGLWMSWSKPPYQDLMARHVCERETQLYLVYIAAVLSLLSTTPPTATARKDAWQEVCELDKESSYTDWQKERNKLREKRQHRRQQIWSARSSVMQTVPVIFCWNEKAGQEQCRWPYVSNTNDQRAWASYSSKWIKLAS